MKIRILLFKIAELKLLVLIFLGVVYYLHWLRNKPHVAYYLEKDSLDVVFIGTSKMYWSVEPRYFDSISGRKSVSISKEQLSLVGGRQRLKGFLGKVDSTIIVLDFETVIKKHGVFNGLDQTKAMNNYYFAEIPNILTRWESYKIKGNSPAYDVLFGAGRPIYSTLLDINSYKYNFDFNKGWVKSWFEKQADSLLIMRKQLEDGMIKDTTAWEYISLDIALQRYLDTLKIEINNFIELVKAKEIIVIKFPVLGDINANTGIFYYLRGEFPMIRFIDIDKEKVEYDYLDFFEPGHPDTSYGRKVLNYLNDYMIENDL